jgi:cell division protein ZapB
MSIMDDRDIKTLARKVDELIKLCASLKQQNKILQANEATLRSERARLVEKNDLARIKVETMISRLKSLEKS